MIHRWKQYKMQIVFLKFQSHRQHSCRVINRLLLTNRSVAFPLLATSGNKSYCVIYFFPYKVSSPSIALKRNLTQLYIILFIAATKKLTDCRVYILRLYSTQFTSWKYWKQLYIHSTVGFPSFVYCPFCSVKYYYYL